MIQPTSTLSLTRNEPDCCCTAPVELIVLSPSPSCPPPLCPVIQNLPEYIAQTYQTQNPESHVDRTFRGGPSDDFTLSVLTKQHHSYSSLKDQFLEKFQKPVNGLRVERIFKIQVTGLVTYARAHGEGGSKLACRSRLTMDHACPPVQPPCMVFKVQLVGRWVSAGRGGRGGVSAAECCFTLLLLLLLYVVVVEMGLAFRSGCRLSPPDVDGCSYLFFVAQVPGEVQQKHKAYRETMTNTRRRFHGTSCSDACQFFVDLKVNCKYLLA